MSEEQQAKRNESREDYLEAILRLQFELPVVRSYARQQGSQAANTVFV